MALLKAGPVASLQVLTGQVFHNSDITRPFIRPQQPLLEVPLSVGFSARRLDTFLDTEAMEEVCPWTTRNSQAYLMCSLLSQAMTLHSERLEYER